MLTRTDPLGRQTTNTYGANGVDLLTVRQTTSGTNDRLVTYDNYTALHQPQTVTDASGQTTTTTYNAGGQILTVTNAKNETTTYAYDSVRRPAASQQPRGRGDLASALLALLDVEVAAQVTSPSRRASI